MNPNRGETLMTQVINISTAGDNSLILAPATTGAYIAVDFLQLIPTTAVTVTFNSGNSMQGQFALSGPYPLSAQQVVTDENVFQDKDGIFTCGVNDDFVITLGGAVQCGGFIRYRLVQNG